MQRNTRNARGGAKPFVSGGVITNFAENKPIEKVPPPSTVSNTIFSSVSSIFFFCESIQTPLQLSNNGDHEKSACDYANGMDGATLFRIIFIQYFLVLFLSHLCKLIIILMFFASNTRVPPS